MIAWLLTPALAGSLDGEIAGDTLYAGPEQDISGAELGLRIRGELLEADDRLVVGLDYRGREALMGPAQTVPLRLLYRGDVAWETERVEVAAGRFVAPAVVWLPMDGARATLRLGETWLTAYGGRRGITASRRPLPIGAFLPAAGLQVGRATEAYRAELIGTWSADRVFLGVPEAEVTEDIGGGSGLARASISPSDVVSFGAQGSAARNATYAVGPAAGELVVSIEALSLYNALGWVALRPTRGLRVDVDAVHQRAELARTATPTDVPLVDPSYSDLRLRAAAGDPAHFWVRPDVRLRLRDQRTELRYGGGADVHDLGVPGPFLRGRLWLEDVLAEGAPDDVAAVDRLLWTASGGYERGAVTVEGGASFVDRSAAPVSGRVSSATAPVVSEDLSPFTLEAQNTLFVRGFFVSRRFFAGADLEANVHDSDVRALLQVGMMGETTW